MDIEFSLQQKWQSSIWNHYQHFYIRSEMKLLALALATMLSLSQSQIVQITNRLQAQDRPVVASGDQVAPARNVPESAGDSQKLLDLKVGNNLRADVRVPLVGLGLGLGLGGSGGVTGKAIVNGNGNQKGYDKGNQGSQGIQGNGNNNYNNNNSNSNNNNNSNNGIANGLRDQRESIGTIKKPAQKATMLRKNKQNDGQTSTRARQPGININRSENQLLDTTEDNDDYLEDEPIPTPTPTKATTFNIPAAEPTPAKPSLINSSPVKPTATFSSTLTTAPAPAPTRSVLPPRSNLSTDPSNQIQGTHNLVDGSQNKVYGHVNYISTGSNNQIYGSGNRVGSEGNYVQGHGNVINWRP